MPGDSSYTSLDRGDSVNRAAIPGLLQPDDEQPIYVNQMPSSDYEEIQLSCVERKL